MTADTIHSYCNIVDCIPCAVLYIPVRGPFLKDILLVIVSVNVEALVFLLEQRIEYAFFILYRFKINFLFSFRVL